LLLNTLPQPALRPFARRGFLVQGSFMDTFVTVKPKDTPMVAGMPQSACF
jgi:hypothetical protein